MRSSSGRDGCLLHTLSQKGRFVIFFRWSRRKMSVWCDYEWDVSVAWDGRVHASCGLREMSVCGESCVCMCRMRWLSMGAAVCVKVRGGHMHMCPLG